MGFCRKCGYNLKADALFCAKCGFKHSLKVSDKKKKISSNQENNNSSTGSGEKIFIGGTYFYCYYDNYCINI